MTFWAKTGGRAFAFAACTLLCFAQGPIDDFESQIKAGQYTEVKSPLESYVSSHPDSWQALYQLGYVDFRLHRVQESASWLSKCLLLHGDFADAHRILAYDLNILGRKDLATSELRKAIRLEPKSSESYYELGRIHYDEGSYLDSVHELEEAERLDPSFVKVHHNLGLAYAAVRDNANAVREFEEGLRLNAKQAKPSAWPLIDYGAYWNLQSNFERAKNTLLEAIRIDGTWEQEFDELSKAYRGLGQTDLAIQSLKRAIAIDPHKAEYHYVLARLYSQAHQPSNASEELAAYEKARQKPVTQ